MKYQSYLNPIRLKFGLRIRLKFGLRIRLKFKLLLKIFSIIIDSISVNIRIYQSSQLKLLTSY